MAQEPIPPLEEEEEILNDIDLDLDEEEEEHEEEDDKDDEKPLTKKDLKEFSKNFSENVKKDIDKRFINKRHQQRDPARKDLPAPKQRVDKEIANDDSRIDKLERNQRITDYATENGISIKESKLVFSMVKNPTAKTLKHPFVQGGLEKLRQIDNADDNIPIGNSARVFSVGGKTWEQMNTTERKQNFTAHQAAILANKK